MTIYENDEFRIYTDKGGVVYKKEFPYTDCFGRRHNTSWELITPVMFNPHDGETFGKITMSRSDIQNLGSSEFRGKVYGPRETFYDDMKFEYGAEAAEALCKFFKREIDKAEKRFQETM